MTSPVLSLLVLKTSRLDPTLAFYRSLGFVFKQEQHGTGAIHYSCMMNELVLEIYPGTEGVAPDRKSGGATMLGFAVTSIDSALAELQKYSAQILTPPKDSPWGPPRHGRRS